MGPVVAIIIFTVDRLLKVMTNSGMLHGSVGPLQLIPLHNPGALGGAFPHQHLLLSVIGVAVIIALTIVWMRHQPVKFESLFQAAWGLLCGGALGNTVDRLVYGYVTDMFHIPHGHGIFNLSDISLQAGVVCLFIYAVIQPKRNQE